MDSREAECPFSGFSQVTEDQDVGGGLRIGEGRQYLRPRPICYLVVSQSDALEDATGATYPFGSNTVGHCKRGTIQTCGHVRCQKTLM